MAAVATELPAAIPRLGAEALFDAVGPSYEQAFETCTEQKVSIDWLLQHLPPNSSVLDIGCGTGRPVCSILADAGHSVLGIDISSAMVDAAIANVPNAKFEKADVKTFTPASSSSTGTATSSSSGTGIYDAITVYFSLIASVTQQEIRDTFSKIYTWLKPGGLFVFATVPISGENLEIAWMGKPIVVSSLSEEEVLEGLKASGFEVLDARTSKFFPEAVKAGICAETDVWEEPHLFVYAKK